MKRNFWAILLAILCVPVLVQAGGLMTNTNQSASYIRMPVLDAVIGPEAVYYNPAGLAFLPDGLHISVSNQTISQKRTIKSTFPGMNQSEFKGTVSAPLFPTAYATFKKDRFAVSLGVNPIGGGGSALFEEGLPSFEQQVAVLPPTLNAAGIPTSDYAFETRFDAQSIFWGVQANATYKVNDFLAVAAGVRYVRANNTYEGYLRDITINPNLSNHPQLHGLSMIYNGSMVSAPTFFNTLAGLLNEQAAPLNALATSLQGIIGMGGGDLLLTQVPGLSPTEIAMIHGGLVQIGYPDDPANLRVNQIHALYQGAYDQFMATKAQMESSAQLTENKAVNVQQTGASIAPIVGLNLRLSDRINLAAKYEHRTALKVKNNTTTDDLGVYPDGLEIANNLPSMLSLGGEFGITEKLTISTGVHYYFDKSASYGKIKEWTMQDGQLSPIFYDNDEIIDNNFWEAGLGAAYQINRNLLVSAGYLRTQTGVNDLYHSDMSHSLSTNSIGAGLRVQFTDLLAINLGGLYTQYVSNTKNFTLGNISYAETYDRTNLVFAVGLDIRL